MVSSVVVAGLDVVPPCVGLEAVTPCVVVSTLLDDVAGIDVEGVVVGAGGKNIKQKLMLMLFSVHLMLLLVRL